MHDESQTIKLSIADFSAWLFQPIIARLTARQHEAKAAQAYAEFLAIAKANGAVVVNSPVEITPQDRHDFEMILAEGFDTTLPEFSIEVSQRPSDAKFDELTAAIGE